MNSSVPNYAETTTINGEPAWVWLISAGRKVLQGPYCVSVENWKRSTGEGWHLFRFETISPRTGGKTFGGFEGTEGHIDKSTFLEVAAKVIEDLRKKDFPPVPPKI